MKKKRKISRYFLGPAPHDNYIINARRAPPVLKSKISRQIERVTPLGPDADADSVMDIDRGAISSSQEDIVVGPSVPRVFLCC